MMLHYMNTKKIFNEKKKTKKPLSIVFIIKFYIESTIPITSTQYCTGKKIKMFFVIIISY